MAARPAQVSESNRTIPTGRS